MRSEARNADAHADQPPDFAALLAQLRTVEPPCLSPTGAGSFDILYASEREIAVWYSPPREGQEAHELIIPGAMLLAAWQAFTQATQQARALDERELCALAGGAFGGRWLAALLAQASGVQAELMKVAIPASVTAPVTAAEGAPTQADNIPANTGEAIREMLTLRWRPSSP